MTLEIATPVVIYGLVCLAASAACFIAYGVDKRRAARDKPRIPETNLHLLELFGGWPGALLARRYFRHKSHKLSYSLILYAIIALHAGLIGLAIYNRFSGRDGA